MAIPRRHIPLKLEMELREIARQYRRRERLRAWLRFGAAFLLLVLLLGTVLEFTNLWTPAVLSVSVVFLVGAWWYCVHRPLKVKPTQEQLALFIDEHHPELQNLAISSVEFSKHGYEGAPDWMLHRFFQDARALTQDLSFGSLVDRILLDRMSVGVGGIWLLALVILGGLITRINLEVRPTSPANTAVVPEIDVSPGDTQLRKGEDLVVWVKTEAIDEGKAIQWRTGDADWQTDVLQASSSASVYYARLENRQVDTEYQVRVGQQNSAIYRATVWEPPEVETLQLTYHFPEYLDLPPREVSRGGNITVPEGSAVDFVLESNKPLSRADLVLGSGKQVSLEETSATTWQGRMAVSQDDTYRIELTDHDGAQNEYQPEFKIVAREDRSPEIRIKFPRGDDEATSLEEIPFSFVAQDDYGLRSYGVQYEIAGRDPVRIGLGPAQGDATDAEVNHLVALEEMGLSAGDFITWTIWAEDRKPERAEFEMLGDPYFLEIRSFHQSFREALSNQGGQQQQNQMQAAGQPQRQAADQKQVIIATWNLRRQARKLGEEEYAQRLSTIIEAQREVQQTALQSDPPPDVAKSLAQEFEAALEALEHAQLPEPETHLSQAIQHQQTAYAHLLRITPDEAQVMQARNAPGAGQQGSSQQQDLDALELTQRRDFREEATTLREQQAETEAARNEIEELAKRQGLINEDIAKLISEMEAMQDQELEEAKRKLKQLEEEQQQAMTELDRLAGEIASGDMDARQARQAQQQLEDARQQMDRTAQGLSEDRLQQARAAGNRALGALNEAQDELENLSRQAASQRMAELREQMDQLRQQQENITEQVRSQQDGEGGPPQPRNLESDADGSSALREEKQQLAQQFKDMMDEASELAERSEETQARMARELGDWLRETAREGIYEDIGRGDQYIRYGAWDAALDHEERVAEELANAAQGLDQVAEHLVRDDLEGMQRALDELEELMDAEAGGQNQSGRNQETAEGQGGSNEDGMRRGAGDLSDDRRFGIPMLSDWGPDDLWDFVDGDYRNWVNRIRNAEDLLADDNPIRQRLGSIREDLDAMRRRFLRDSEPPRYDLVFDQAIKPLTLVAEDLKRSIREQQSEFVFGPESEGEVPAQYRTRVARYFESLAEME